MGRKIKSRMLIRIMLAVPFMLAIFFLPAGTFDFWQAWVYLAILVLPLAFIIPYFMKTAPDLLERRMRTKERETRQRTIIGLSGMIFLVAFAIPGFDRRWGWSHVPLAVVILAQMTVMASYAMNFMVMKVNSFASRTVEVEQGQQLITRGPYALVRHPMYTSLAIMYLATPLALASWWGLIPFVLMVGILVARIRSEEDTLSRELPGYTEYMQQTRYRLIPGMW